MTSRTLPLPPPVPWTPGLTGDYPGQQSQITLPGDVPMVFCWCPPPRPEGRNQLDKQRNTTIPLKMKADRYVTPFIHGFWLAKHPVNQAQWHAVMQRNPSHCKGDDLPVEQVSWNDVQLFCKKTDLVLPTESMWEYACRAGSLAPSGISTGIDLDSQQANFDGRFPYGAGIHWLNRERTTRQGSFPPNDWGLHDMQGQVWEWCHDSIDGRDRVLRGGSWSRIAHSILSAIRIGSPPQYRSRNIGFRPSCNCDATSTEAN